MADLRPVLVVDVGGTLLSRTRPGQTERIVRAVRRAHGITAAAESALRRIVLTSPDADACLEALRSSPELRPQVAAELAADPGDAVVLPGAEDLLRTATANGWRIVVASNAGPGTPSLPKALAVHVESVAESRTCGFVKSDPRFWSRLIDSENLDPRLTLVIGDQAEDDRAAPVSAGLQARLVRAGRLGDLAADLDAAGPPPPWAIAVVAGVHERWAGQDVAPAPHLGSMVTRVTRVHLQYSIQGGGGPAVVARRRSGPPAVVSGGPKPLPGVAWLLQGRDRSPYTVPGNLRGILKERGLSLDVLSKSDRRHALSMIHEARNDATVAERTADLVRFLEERSADDATRDS
jgi:FMN phosphatase YigB (HAD superfamily)